jgi:hypothetical protein
LERTPDERLKSRSRRERIAFLFWLAAVAGAGWLRSRSPLARQLADGPVWAAATPAAPDSPAVLWRYDASTRDLRAVLIPNRTLSDAGRTSRSEAARDAATALGAGNLHWLDGVEPPDAQLGSSWGARPSLWMRLAHPQQRPRSDLSRSDWVFAGLETLALPPGERPVAELPVRGIGRGLVPDAQLIDRLRQRFFSAPVDAVSAKASAEILNASGKDGLALTATQALRSRGIDVLFYGSADAPSASTRIVDRDGDRRAAEQVRRALGIDIPIVTQLSPYPKAEATLILGADFPEQAVR